MKKTILLAGFTFCVTFLFAHTIKINVVNFQFKAKTVNAVVGDTILWVWKTGIHTTTSTSVPSGAKSWDHPMDSAHKKFRYIVRVAGTYQYHCTFHFSIGMKGTIVVSASLAPGLQNVSVNDDDPGALISWATQSPDGLSYFSVQRSTDGDNFKEIGRVYANATNRYSLRDQEALSSEYTYYQVDMVDTRGNHQLSEIKMFSKLLPAAKLITSISPNPVINPGHIMLQFNADREGTLIVQLYNQSGVLVTQTEMSAYKGLNNGHFHLGDLTPGTYYIICTLGSTREKHTIIVK